MALHLVKRPLKHYHQPCKHHFWLKYFSLNLDVSKNIWFARRKELITCFIWFPAWSPRNPITFSSSNLKYLFSHSDQELQRQIVHDGGPWIASDACGETLVKASEPTSCDLDPKSWCNLWGKGRSSGPRHYIPWTGLLLHNPRIRLFSVRLRRRTLESTTIPAKQTVTRIFDYLTSVPNTFHLTVFDSTLTPK